jgi:hypothetical protein
MNMIAKLIPPITGDDVVAVLKNRLRELDARDSELTTRIVAMEGGTRRSDAAVTQAERAARILDGESFDPSYRPPMAQLTALHAERDLVRKALAIGQSRLQEELLRCGTEIWARHFSEIARIEKRRVFLAMELQRVNVAREHLREKLIEAGAPGHLPTDSIDLLELPRNDDEVHRAGDRLVQHKVATSREIEAEKSRG